jgi:hypothetical protein
MRKRHREDKGVSKASLVTELTKKQHEELEDDLSRQREAARAKQVNIRKIQLSFELQYLAEDSSNILRGRRIVKECQQLDEEYDELTNHLNTALKETPYSAAKKKRLEERARDKEQKRDKEQAREKERERELQSVRAGVRGRARERQSTAQRSTSTQDFCREKQLEARNKDLWRESERARERERERDLEKAIEREREQERERTREREREIQ